MQVLPDTDQAMVQQLAGDFLAAESTPARVRGAEKDPSRMSDELWAQVAALGWLGVSLPEACGGQGLHLSTLGLVFEELGRHLAPVPLLSTVVPALILARHGAAAQLALLADVVAGRTRLSFAVQEADGRWDAQATRMRGVREGHSIVLSGCKAFVPYFDAARHCLVAFRLDGEPGLLSLALVDTQRSGITHSRLVPTGGDSEQLVQFDSVRIAPDDLVGAPGRAGAVIEEMMDLAAALTAAQMVGAAHQATQRAAEYARQRHAFGQPIGAFQAIQHMAADMLIGVDGAQLLTREAIWRLGEGLPAQVEVSQAKAFANEKCLMAVRAAQQIHGGIGFIADFDQQLWYRRVTSWSLRAGTVMEHRARIAAALLDNQGTVRLGEPVVAA